MAESILLVDDEEGIRRVLGLSLADMGYHVLTAASGEEGLETFAARRPGIVLTDIKMPGLGGIELLERIKALDPEAEVIMITGHGDLELAIQSLKRDATDFVLKPISDDALEVALKRATERLALHRQLRAHRENLEALVREQSAKLVEAERQLAARQAVDGLSHAMSGITQALDGGPEGAGVFNQMPCFVSMHSRYLEILAVNQAYRERLGNLVGHNSWEPYVGRDRPSEGCPVLRAIESGSGYRGHETLRGRDGRDIPVIVHTAPILDNEGEVELVLEIAVDVAEIRRLQDELKASQQRFQQLFEEAPCYITVQDRSMRIMAANRRFRQDFGPVVGEVPAGFCHQVFAHLDAACPECPAAQTLADGRTHQAELVVTAKDGLARNVLINTALLGEGPAAQVVEMSTDITQLRALQDRLTTLGLLLGSTAHGIKGQLTALDGGVYRLGSGLTRGDDARVRDAFEDIRHMVGRIRKTVLDILYYAKERALNWQVLDARSFAEGLAAVVRTEAAARGVELLLELPEELGTLEADEAAVSSALVNILENAIQAAGAAATGARRVTLAVRPAADGFLEFAVTDSGPGMDRATRERLFTLFFSSKGSSGTGLGLYVAKAIVTQHGGRILVESEPGQGACFRALLPRVLPEEAKAPLEHGRRVEREIGI